ncbi:MAG TPA: carbon storage regulator [Gammaproteobacteria bacterium]|nr:carbon storage regulator [Gammaproteobacteria bacterium]
MLTISRKPNEALIIQTPDGEEIHVFVHGFQKDLVKVSIDASLDYVITREELLDGSIA